EADGAVGARFHLGAGQMVGAFIAQTQIDTAIQAHVRLGKSAGGGQACSSSQSADQRFTSEVLHIKSTEREREKSLHHSHHSPLGHSGAEPEGSGCRKTGGKFSSKKRPSQALSKEVERAWFAM